MDEVVQAIAKAIAKVPYLPIADRIRAEWTATVEAMPLDAEQPPKPTDDEIREAWATAQAEAILADKELADRLLLKSGGKTWK